MIIQIVEDDKALSDGIEISLSDGDTEFIKAYTIAEAAAGFENLGDRLGLIILDINLPDGIGYDNLKAVRKKSNVPVLILTANDMELDEVKGLPEEFHEIFSTGQRIKDLNKRKMYFLKQEEKYLGSFNPTL